MNFKIFAERITEIKSRYTADIREKGRPMDIIMVSLIFQLRILISSSRGNGAEDVILYRVCGHLLNTPIG